MADQDRFGKDNKASSEIKGQTHGSKYSNPELRQIS